MKAYPLSPKSMDKHWFCQLGKIPERKAFIHMRDDQFNGVNSCRIILIWQWRHCHLEDPPNSRKHHKYIRKIMFFYHFLPQIRKIKQ